MILINGEMPKSCSECQFCTEDKYADMSCVLLGSEWEANDYNSDYRDEKCPIIDVITNGDMIKAMFPNNIISTEAYGYYVPEFNCGTFFDEDWWNAPYKREEQSE